MKKWIVLGLFMALMGGLQAQSGWSVTPRGGMQVYVMQSNMVGFYVGATAQYRFGPVWALQMGALYANGYESYGSGNRRVEHMLHFPIQVKAYVREGWYLATGPQFHMPFASSTRWGDSKTTHTDVEGGVSWMVGTGYDFPCGLTLNFDYAYGSPVAFMSYIGGDRSSWHLLQIGLGRRFGKGK